jgi:hypothetical protein
MNNDNRKVIFWIIGTLLVLLFFGLLFWVQTNEGDANILGNKYQIEIFNCSPVAKDQNELNIELNSILKSTSLTSENQNQFLTPVLKVDKLEFGIPIYGMNYLRYSMDSSMYLYEDRAGDEDVFFNSNNDRFEEVKTRLLKPSGKKYDDVEFDFNNNIDEFIIYLGQKQESANNKKTWRSLASLKNYIDGLVKTGKIVKNSKIKIYYLCGEPGKTKKTTTPKPSKMDRDKDGVTDDIDQCVEIPGDIKCSGCKCAPPKPGIKDSDFDMIPDDIDKCPKVYGIAKYKGCPIPDSDGDGWNDEIDKCPKISGEENGCPIETEPNATVPDPGVALVNSKLIFSGINEAQFKEGFRIKIIISLRNGNTRDYFVTNINCPKDKNEGNTIFNKLGDFTSGLNLTFELWKKSVKVSTLNKSFNNISLVCKLDGDCGFKQY